jgi:MazG family protein
VSGPRPSSPPPGPSPDAASALSRLESLIDSLLAPVGGCPWDKKQTTKTVTEDFLEEVYELRQALLEDSGPEVLEESGDVAFLLVFLGRLTQGRFGFGLKETLDAATDKMLSRHPHVFGEVEIPDDIDVFFKLWHKLKREAKPKKGVLASVPTALPALTRCHRLSQKAGRAGFDFPSVAEVRRQVDSELFELDKELAAPDLGTEAGQARLFHEIGDVLCSVANLARLAGVSAEKALDACNRRFVKRFEHMEADLAARDLRPEDASPEELEKLWAAAKAALAASESEGLPENGPGEPDFETGGDSAEEGT